MIPFHEHQLTDFDTEKIAEILRSRFITSGSVGRFVEEKIANYFNVKHAFLTNSWTNGGIAALLAIDLGPGDEVIVPAMSFIATSNIICLLGATPVFVDVNPETLLMDIDEVRNAITSKTKAIMPVHLYGQMVDLGQLEDLCNSHANIYLIEDAAHCFEGERSTFKPGHKSDFAIFSFYATKNITCGEGGAVITNNDHLASRFKVARLHGMSASADRRYVENSYRHWEMESLGAKANLTDLLAVLLPDQIDLIDHKLLERQAIASYYRECFDGNNNIRLQNIEPDVKSAEHVFPIHVLPKYRDDLIKHLNDEGLQVAVHFRSIPSNPYYQRKYQYADDFCPISFEWGEGQISLPVYPGLGVDNASHYVDAVESFFGAKSK